MKYDSCASDNTSDYTKSNSTLSYNSNGYYIASQTNDNAWAYAQLTNGTFTTPCEISADINFTSTGNNQFILGLFGSSEGYGGRYSKIDSTLYLVKLTGASSPSTLSSKSLTISLNTWYHYIVQITNNSLTVKIYDMNNNLIGEGTQSISSFTGGKLHLVKGVTRNETISIKNIKVKPL